VLRTVAKSDRCLRLYAVKRGVESALLAVSLAALLCACIQPANRGEFPDLAQAPSDSDAVLTPAEREALARHQEDSSRENPDSARSQPLLTEAVLDAEAACGGLGDNEITLGVAATQSGRALLLEALPPANEVPLRSETLLAMRQASQMAKRCLVNSGVPAEQIIVRFAPTSAAGSAPQAQLRLSVRQALHSGL